MPPRCPQCGRFLSRSFVEELEAGAQPCPRCGSSLLAEDLTPSAPASAGNGGQTGERPAEPVAPTAERPAEAVAPSGERHVERDVLAGWDEPGTSSAAPASGGAVGGFEVVSLAPRFLPLVGAAVGGLLGAAASPRSRPLGAALGAAAGAGVTFAVVRSRRR